MTKGNTNLIGIEAENTGLSTDLPWPKAQMEAYHHGVAAILTHIGRGAESCAGHKEYALPSGRKNDPSFDMDMFRASVTAIINGAAPALAVIPAIEPTPQPGASAGRPTLRRGATGELVEQVQKKLGIAADGNFGSRTEAAVRNFQRNHGLVPDGIIGPGSWLELDAAV